MEVISTLEQLLGGRSGHVYEGCRFPANPAYGSRLAAYGAAVGERLADHGALGRVCVDCAATRSPGSAWRVYGLEVNLRKSGTSHPLWLLHHLVPGHYDRVTGNWLAQDGSERCYRSTDNLVDPSWRGRPLTTSSRPSARPDWSSTPGPGWARSSTCSSDSTSTVGSGSRRSAAHPITPNGCTGRQLWRSRPPVPSTQLTA